MAKRGRKPKFTPEQIAAQKAHILDAMEALGGLQPFADLAQEVGMEPTDLRRALNELLDEGRIVRHGEKKGAKYTLCHGDPVPRDEQEADKNVVSGSVSLDNALSVLRVGRHYTIDEAAQIVSEATSESKFRAMRFITNKAKCGELGYMKTKGLGGNRLAYFMQQ